MTQSRVQGLGEKELEIQPQCGRQTWPPAMPFCRTETIFNQGEKACWEEQLAQVGTSPATGVSCGDDGGNRGAGHLLALRGGGRRGEGERRPTVTDKQTGLEVNGLVRLVPGAVGS